MQIFWLEQGSHLSKIVETRMSQSFCSKFTFAVITVALWTGFQHGYHMGAVNISSDKWLKNIKTETSNGTVSENLTVLWSTAVAAFSIGGLLGSLFLGYVADRWSRKNTLMVSNTMALMGGVCLICSNKINIFQLFIVGRLLIGVTVGLGAGLCQIYLVEISPDNIRGLVCSCYFLSVNFSMLLAQIFGITFCTKEIWNILFLATLLPPAIQIFSLPFCPISPRYLLMTDKNEIRAIKALIWLRGNRNVKRELNDLIEEDNKIKEMRTNTLRRFFMHPKKKNCLIFCLAMNIGAQLCGVKCMLYFSVRIFQEAGLSRLLSLVGTVGGGIVTVLTVIFVMILIDNIGRRILLLSSFLAMTVITIILTYLLIQTNGKDSSDILKYCTLAFSVLWLVMYSVGAGPIPWFLPAELFDSSNRSFAISISHSANWFFDFLAAQAFLAIKGVLGYYIFGIFIILDTFFFCCSRRCPETRHLSALQVINSYKM